MVETETKNLIRVAIAGANMTAAEAVSGMKPEKKEYDSDKDGDLFLYQMAQAIEGVKEALPKINFRRRHPQLGKKIANLERRVTTLERTVRNFKKVLKTDLEEGLKRIVLEMVEETKDCMIEML